jgi:hypothetical protein
MIDDAALLQADVTIIAGILIFLTVAPPPMKDKIAQFKKEKRNFVSIVLTMILLVFCAISALLGSYFSILLLTAKFALIGGLGGVIVTIVTIMSKPGWTTSQRPTT